ncbi:bifunctional protein-disulfide isomerase/oxidoreductase DsbC [Serratia symbiotica]|uniref:Thiol:disulfide interchange protein n=1 Tax=Serratia symbiotica TaxID=138074 RepID=A0A068ZD15_9GAMM|nr:bifunctional protein-disulfide isomerase/oxidoreductase DsbC [Serratia symbiotica]MBF1996028.1 bifunctional protein-disulfide isomerase/oxidoreductase DsbC [Serratia symbiotica]MBQ0954566.1 bifunctional protein-disulfide isomerase/oxidoreductase DsbC [Serratia symbiotica]QLH63625.1 bifunctional protein-disulfide isomerase/oxidoreductase DsbC [Serratia symbiotica]QTP14014.1 bifunctional protein-disulfide isomerase/oxidoreductase DsbC [Serratia symbiotica]CDS58987.1 protein disulfide isomeras
MKKGLMLLSLLVAAVTSAAHADDAAIKKALDSLGIQQANVRPSSVKGLKTVLTDSGVLYVSEDGKHILHGPLYDISGKVPVNVTNQLLVTQLEALQDQMIVYKAPKEKHVITVFTDSTCGYCHKLHQQMHEYNDLGITVRYLAFPRQGRGSQIEKDMQSIWCSADKAKAFDAAMKGDAVSPATCKTDISKHYALGVQFGIQGTPAIILENGMMIPGYQGPKEMAAMLGANQVATKAGG